MPGAFRRVMVYLGLVDDDYEDYEPYEDPQTVAPPARPQVRSAYAPETSSDMTAGVRTLPREPDPMSGVSIQPRPAVVRPIQPTQATKVHVVVPSSFNDAKEIFYGPTIESHDADHSAEEERYTAYGMATLEGPMLAIKRPLAEAMRSPATPVRAAIWSSVSPGWRRYSQPG